MLHLNETTAKDAIDVVDPPAIGNHLLYITKSIDASSSPAAAIPDGNEKSDGSLQPEQLEDHVDKASTSNIAALSGMEITETTVNDNSDALKPEVTSASSTDSRSLSSPLDPSEASSSTDARRGGRKRGSKNLLFAKNSLDLVDAIKSLLPPQQSSDENSAPKKRRRRRKASIQAAALEAVKTEGDENMDLIASSNATES
uniref:Uncharacterized protein n=1 Tax=Panagrolaimus davidi TaxID=227884 RepID=A0A914Q9K2_9BILA